MIPLAVAGGQVFRDRPSKVRLAKRNDPAGADAAIVQDIGNCRLIRRLSPDFPIHASTQMTITSAAGVEFDPRTRLQRIASVGGMA